MSSQFAFWVKEKNFKDGSHGMHFGFPIEKILAIFDLQVTLILPTKLRVNWPFGSGEKVQNRLSTRRLWLPFLIFDREQL